MISGAVKAGSLERDYDTGHDGEANTPRVSVAAQRECGGAPVTSTLGLTMREHRDISAEELELLSFFEVEPKRQDDGAEWPYNDFLYEVTQEDLHLSCAITPAYRDARIMLKRGGITIYELNAMDLEDVRYFNEKGRETLAFILNDRETLSLRIKPGISINHEVKGET
jgi:hypothetical protein